MKRLFLFLSILLCMMLITNALADVVNITVTDMVATGREGEVFSSSTRDEVWTEEGSSTFSSGMDASLYKLQYTTVNGEPVAKSASVTLNHADYIGVSNISVVFMWKQRAVQPVDPPAEDPPAEDPPAEDPPAEDPPAEDPPAEDPPAENPPADDPPAENPPVDNPPADNPPADNPPADDPPAEDPPIDNPPAENQPDEPGDNQNDAPEDPPADIPVDNPGNLPADDPVIPPEDTHEESQTEINPPEEQPAQSEPDPVIPPPPNSEPTEQESTNPDPVSQEIIPEQREEVQEEPQPAAEKKEEKKETKQEEKKEETQEDPAPLVIVSLPDPVNEEPITYSAPDIVEIYVDPTPTPTPTKKSKKKKKDKATPTPPVTKTYVITILDANMKPITQSVHTDTIGSDGMLVWMEEIGAYLAVEVR